MSAVHQLGPKQPLRIEANPFVSEPGGPRIGRPLQTALGQLIRQVVLETPLVLVTGNAGSGKSLLVEMTARACSDMALSVRRVDRGDLVHVALSQRSDLLLVDEADLIADTTLQVLLSADCKKAATTIVFLCLPACAGRFANSEVRPVIIELTPLSQPYAQNYLMERATSAGFANLFEPEALDLVAYGSRGSPRLLRSIASLAFFCAASDRASQIGVKHVTSALASQINDVRNTSRAQIATQTSNNEPQTSNKDQSARSYPLADAAPPGAANIFGTVQPVGSLGSDLTGDSAAAANASQPLHKFSSVSSAPLANLAVARAANGPGSGRWVGRGTVALVALLIATSPWVLQTAIPPAPADARAALAEKQRVIGTLASLGKTKQDGEDFVASINPARVSQTAPPSPSAAPLSSGRVYGADNTNSRLTLRVHRPTQVTVSGRRDQLLLKRSLQSGDTYRAPNLPNLAITTLDAGAVEVMFDGESIGFVGTDGASVSRVPLMPAFSANEAQSGAAAQKAVAPLGLPNVSAMGADEAGAVARGLQAMAAEEAVERKRSAGLSAMGSDQAGAVARGLQAMAAGEAAERKRSAELSAIGADEARVVAARGLSAREETADQAELTHRADQARAATGVATQTAGLNAAIGEARTGLPTGRGDIAREEGIERASTVQETTDQTIAVTNTAEAITENEATDPAAANQTSSPKSQGWRWPLLRSVLSLLPRPAGR